MFTYKSLTKLLPLTLFTAALSFGQDFVVKNNLTSVLMVAPAINGPLSPEERLVVSLDDKIVYVDVKATNDAADGTLRLYTMSPNSSLSVEPFKLSGKQATLKVVEQKAYESNGKRILKEDANSEAIRFDNVKKVLPKYFSPEHAAVQERINALRTKLNKDDGEFSAARTQLGKLMQSDTHEVKPLDSITVQTVDGPVKVKIKDSDIQTRSDLVRHIITGNLTGDEAQRFGSYVHLPRQLKCIDLYSVLNRELGSSIVEVRSDNNFTAVAKANDEIFAILTLDGSEPLITSVPRHKQKQWNGLEPVFSIKEVVVLK